MNPAIKIVVALLVAALIAVVGLIVITDNSSEAAKAPEVTTAPAATEQLAQAAISEATEVPAATSEPADTEEAENSADNEAPAETVTEAQGTMYEGALAGLTEEEIAALAMAEEHSEARTDETSGVEDPVD